VNESKFISFGDFRREMSPSVDYIQEEDEEFETSDDPLVSYQEFISKLETIDNEEIPEEVDILHEDVSDERKPVNVIMGRFQPFHHGHLKMAKALKEKNNLPSYVVVVYPGHNKSGKSPFDNDSIKMYMDSIVSNNEEIEGYMMVNRGLLGSAISKLIDMGYDPRLIGAGPDRKDDYTKQIDYIKMSDIKDKISDELEIVETPRVTSGTDVRQAIKDQDFSKFKKMVPQEVSNLYNDLITKVRD